MEWNANVSNGNDDADGWDFDLPRMTAAMGFADDLAATSEPMDMSSSNPNANAAYFQTKTNPHAFIPSNPMAPTFVPSMNPMLGAPNGGLTSSASCPSFSSMYDFNTDDLLQDIPDQEPIELPAPSNFLAEEELNASLPGADANAEFGYDYVLQMQQTHQTNRMRQFPHSQQQAGVDLPSPMPAMPMRRAAKLHMSQSFTSLASMETENKRRMMSKRKKGVERWHKQQRHKSFDSNVSEGGSPSRASMELPSAPGENVFGSTPRGTMSEGPNDNEMVGFSLDEFAGASDNAWPASTPLEPLPEPNDSIDNGLGDSSNTDSAANEIDLLLSDEQGRANVSKLFDAIRDFDTTTQSKEETPVPAVESSTDPATPVLKKEPKANLAAPEDKDVKPIQERVQLILDSGKNSQVLPISLLSSEREYLRQSALFTPAKAQETAGSLWLLFHSSTCQDRCGVAGCDVMRRVVRHCRSCGTPLGQCKAPCNEAKSMLLHHATCRPLRKQGALCAVCMQVDEIERTQNTMKPEPPVPSGMATYGFSGLPLAAASLLAAHHQPTYTPAPKSANGAARHVPIQPNPLPTASNSMGLMRPFPTLGCSLALYLEQTSPPFRAEVKARVEKRVTSAAGQDLIQHMQKKTRLRSLDDLRSEARGIVLNELERELHFHMQAVNWASMASKASVDAGTPTTAAKPSGESPLPTHLLNAAAAGFAAYYAQQAGTPREVSTPTHHPAPQATPSVKTLKHPSNGRKTPAARLPVGSSSSHSPRCEGGTEAALAV